MGETVTNKSATIKARKKKSGSVKDIFEYGNDLLFKYSDRYSIFDYGEMPDSIPKKGEALGLIAYLFFKKLDQINVPHHFLNLRKRKKDIVVQKFEIKSEDEYQNQKVINSLVPLEVIFRFGIPEGSSLPSRLPQHKIGDLFDSPLIEFSTKLEATDRYLTLEEAKRMANLSTLEMEKLMERTKEISLHLKKMFMEEMNITLWDGKFEFGFIEGENSSERDFMIVDSIGPDELRLTYQDLHLSKEFLRQSYKNSSWKKAVGLAKKDYGENWKQCLYQYNVAPEHLDERTVNFASMIYKTLANAMAISEGMKPPFKGPSTIKELYKIYQQTFFH